MTTVRTNIDLKNLFFEHPVLTLIRDEPTISPLITLRNEVKANAMSVHTTLGGGAHGHLGLVVSAQEYATIPATTEYIRPVHPGVINIPNAATKYVITNIRETHHKNLRQFREVIGVERALIQQIVAAVDPKYLKAHK